eukprot:3239742-Prymnesium_polylepis.1
MTRRRWPGSCPRDCTWTRRPDHASRGTAAVLDTRAPNHRGRAGRAWQWHAGIGRRSGHEGARGALPHAGRAPARGTAV